VRIYPPNPSHDSHQCEIGQISAFRAAFEGALAHLCTNQAGWSAFPRLSPKCHFELSIPYLAVGVRWVVKDGNSNLAWGFQNRFGVTKRVQVPLLAMDGNRIVRRVGDTVRSLSPMTSLPRDAGAPSRYGRNAGDADMPERCYGAKSRNRSSGWGPDQGVAGIQSW
jgi:hypothetical protein